MSGNTTTSNNFTGLYGASGGTTVPTTPYGNANVVSLLAVGSDGANTVGNITATGNVSANYFIGNGSQLTGIVTSSYGNAQVASFLSAFGSNTISTTGNVTSGNLLTGGAVSATGNVSGAYIFGNGSQLTGLPATYSNANVTTLLANFGSNSISTTGNITAGNFAGNGSQLSAIAGANVNGTVANATYATSAGSATTAGTVTANAQPNITSTGTLSTLSVSGNTTSGNLLTPGTISASGNITTAGYFVGTFLGNIVGNLIVPGANTQVLYNNNGNADASAGFTFDSAANLVTVSGNITGGNVSTAGNITASYILGNGSQLSAITGANVTGTVANAAYATSAGSATTAVTANTVTDPAQANITSVGTLTTVSVSGNTTTGNLLTAGIVSATGNITGSYIFGNGSQLTGLPAGYSNADVTTLLAAFGSNTISTTGNVDTGNLGVSQNAIILGNLTVQGTTTTVNSNTVTINDKFINVANNAATPGDANGGGIGVGPVGSEYATLTFNSAATAWNTNIPLSVTGNISGGNVLASGAVSAVGNITGSYIIGNGSLLTDINASNIVGAYGNAQVASFLNAFGSNSISTTGNITSSYISGNGSLLTSITGGNVTGTVANATFATSAGTATFAGTANAVAGANVSGTVANATYALNSNAATFAGTVTTNAQPNITSVGILTAVNTSGAVSATGNITGAYFLGNGSQLTGLPATYGNANVSNFLANGFGSNVISTTGNITGGNLLTGGASGNIQGVNYITANYYIGNGSALTGINPAPLQGNLTGNISGIDTYGITNLKTLQVSALGNVRIGTAIIGQTSASPATINIQADEVSTNLLFTAGGNITAPNVIATANAFATYFIGNGSQLTGITANGSSTSISDGTSNVKIVTANGNATVNIGGTSNVVQWATTGEYVTGVISASGNITGSNITTPGFVSAAGNIAATGWVFGNTGGSFNGPVYGANVFSTTGNIIGANMIATGLICATGNITTGQSTIVGTANTTGGVGNIILSGKNIATDMIRNPDSGTGTTADAARIVIGTGFNGNVSPGIAPINGGTMGSRLYIGDSFNRGNSAIQARTVYISDFTTLTANVTNNAMRINGLTSQPAIGGGSAGNTITGTVFTIAGMLAIPVIGGGLTGNITSLGNTTAQYVVGVTAGVTTQQGSNTGNAIGYLSQHNATSGAGNFANTMIGVSQNTTGNVTPTTYISYHQPSNVATYGASLTNQTRAAANYYFLKNDDAVAQAQIGSLRSYSEFNYTNTVTSGAVTIDKTNAQVQQVNLTGNVTSLTYSNFVSSASDGTNTDEQADTVTIIFNQGATGGYSVTFPSGSAYKYAGGLNTLAATTANSVTLVAITAIRISGTTTYLTTISPAFT